MAGGQSHATIAHDITRGCNRNLGTAITYAAILDNPMLRSPML